MVRINWRIAFAFTAVLAVVFAVLALPVGGPARRGNFGLQFATQLITWGLWLALSPVVFATARRAHALKVASWRGVALHVIAGVVLAFIHSALFAFVRWKLIVDPAQDVRAVVAATVGFVYGSDVLKYVLLAALYHSLVFHREAQDRMLSESKLSALLAQSRLEVLEARLHPHFLFNTLNAITVLIRKDPSSAITMVEHLSDLLRAALRSEPGKMVTLGTELDLLRRYLSIQQVRFSDRLRVDVSASPESLARPVPQLILQPLVENAIQHGIAPREAAGHVSVHASIIVHNLHVVIRDDGIGFGMNGNSAPQRENSGFGINNTRARLVELYGDRFSFEISDAKPTGTIVTLVLPAQRQTIAGGESS